MSRTIPVKHSSNQYADIPVRSQMHPIIPQLYVPGWKTNMPNRNLMMKNAELASLPNARGPHDESLYIEKRERLSNVEWEDRVHRKRPYTICRNEALCQPLEKSQSRYQSHLNYRTGDPANQPEIPVQANIY